MDSVLTHSETQGTKDHLSLAAAFLHSKEDSSVWKISYRDGESVIRLVREKNCWKREARK